MHSNISRQVPGNRLASQTTIGTGASLKTEDAESTVGRAFRVLSEFVCTLQPASWKMHSRATPSASSGLTHRTVTFLVAAVSISGGFFIQPCPETSDILRPRFLRSWNERKEYSRTVEVAVLVLAFSGVVSPSAIVPLGSNRRQRDSRGLPAGLAAPTHASERLGSRPGDGRHLCLCHNGTFSLSRFCGCAPQLYPCLSRMSQEPLVEAVV